MSDTTYRITIKNSTGSDKRYCVFNEPPKAVAGGAVPFANAWQIVTVLDGQSETITVTKQYFAYIGTSPQSLGPGVVISGGGVKSVKLGATNDPGSTWKIINTDSNKPKFDTELFRAGDGRFEIQGGTDFTANDGWVFGIGMQDNDGNPHPVVTVQANPNLTYAFQPVVKYYISEFEGKVGEIVNWGAISTDAGLVDFEANAGSFGCTITQDTQGKFKPSYAKSLTFALLKELELESRASTNGIASGNDFSFLRTQVERAAMQLEYYGGATEGWTRYLVGAFFKGVGKGVAMKGFDMMIQELRNRGYRVPGDPQYKGDDSGATVTNTVEQPPPKANGLVAGTTPLDQAKADWAIAVSKDTQADGHADSGVVQG